MKKLDEESLNRAPKTLRNNYSVVRFDSQEKEKISKCIHGKAGRKLDGTSSHREAMFRNMRKHLIIKRRKQSAPRIPSPRKLRKLADNMVTLGKERGSAMPGEQGAGDCGGTGRRWTSSFGELAGRFRDRAGGYTRIVKVGYRFGDNAPVSIIEYLPDEQKKRKGEAEKKGQERPVGISVTGDKKAGLVSCLFCGCFFNRRM